MFKDRNAELQRLEEALLEEEEEVQVFPPEEVPEDEELLSDDTLDALLEDIAPPQATVPYQNFSNDYGNAYKADRTDVDPEDYRDQLQSGRKDRSGLVIVACLLALGVLGMIIFLMLKQGGFL